MKLRSAISIILSFVVLYNVIFSVMTFGWYQINKKEITDKYCVNKEMPKMNCAGKCHLNKVMKAAQEEQNEDKEVSPPQLEFFFEKKELAIVKEGFDSERLSFYSYQEFWSESILDSNYHPPQV